MQTNNNVNYNSNVKKGFSKNHNDNYNDMDRAREVERIAQQLVDKFKSSESFAFYCQVAYSLPESTIWINYERSLKGRTPGNLFNWLCRKDMSRR